MDVDALETRVKHLENFRSKIDKMLDVGAAAPAPAPGADTAARLDALEMGNRIKEVDNRADLAQRIDAVDQSVQELKRELADIRNGVADVLERLQARADLQGGAGTVKDVDSTPQNQGGAPQT